MEKRKAICYANLNCKNASRDVTDEQMELYFKRFCLHTNVEPVQFVIDRYDESTYKSKRTGWNHVLDVCKEGTVELILVPTYLMVCSAFIDTLEEIRELKSKYNVPFYFIRERLYTEEENFETTFQLHMMVQDHIQYCKKNVLEMRSEFFEATGCKAEDASAIKVQIDDMINKNGFENLTPKNSLDGELIKTLYCDNYWTDDEIAFLLSTSTNHISSFRKIHNIKRSKRDQLSRRLSLDEFCELYLIESATVAQIAEIYRVSDKAVTALKTLYGKQDPRLKNNKARGVSEIKLKILKKKARFAGFINSDKGNEDKND